MREGAKAPSSLRMPLRRRASKRRVSSTRDGEYGEGAARDDDGGAEDSLARKRAAIRLQRAVRRSGMLTREFVLV